MVQRTLAGPLSLVIMGVSGAGKTTIGRLLAQRLGWQFAEADDFHPRANIDKMSNGVPLTDADRLPWLRRLRDWLAARFAAGESTVVTCSALKRTYRDILREGAPHVRFILLHGEIHTLADRLEQRQGHFMPAALLTSQIIDLEPLQSDEHGLVMDVTATPAAIVEAIVAELDLPASSTSGRRHR